MKKNLIANIFTNVLAISISMLISIWLTPYLINKLGLIAYGYIGILANLINFMAVITYTLNSMVGRFFTVSYKKNGAHQASEYISSALFSSIFIGAALFPLLLILSKNLNKFIHVQDEYILDITISFILSSIAFILSSISAVLSTGAYSKNRLDISNAINIISNIVRIIILLILFKLYGAHIWYISIASVIQVLITIILGASSFKALLPDIHFHFSLFKFNRAFEILSSGLFNSIIILGNIFLTQIDLIVGNRYLPGEIVGLYAAVLLIPNSIRNIASALSSAFSPSTLLIYSAGNMQELSKYTNKVVRFCGLIIGWPVSIISGLALPVLKIWLNRDYSGYEYIIILMILPLTVNLAVSQLYIVQQAMNRVKVPALASITFGGLNLIMAVLFTKTLEMGILGIVFSGFITFTLRSFIFMPFYTAIITNQPRFTYYKGILIPLIISSAICALGFLIQKLITINTKFSLLSLAVFLSLLYFSVSFFSLNTNERLNIRENSLLIVRTQFKKTTSFFAR